MATLPGRCRQRVGHALVTYGWGTPPYFAPGVAPLPACWGRLAIRVLVGLLRREGFAVLLIFCRGPARSERSRARSYACGYTSPAGRARSRRAGGSIRPKRSRAVVRVVGANPPPHTRARCTRQAGATDASARSSGYHACARQYGSGREACAEVSLPRRATQPSHGQMLLPQACLLHLPQAGTSSPSCTRRAWHYGRPLRPACTPMTSPRGPRGPDWQAQAPLQCAKATGPPRCHASLFRCCSPQLGCWKNAAVRAWEDLP